MLDEKSGNETIRSLTPTVGDTKKFPFRLRATVLPFPFNGP